MIILKCKMCGGDLEIQDDSSVCECEYCGTKQTVPKVDDEKKLKLFSRAGRLLRACEFDKAAGVYEAIVADFDQEAEAYWGLILCKYGIEYVDDPASGRKIPTCHRSSFDSVMEDSNFELVMENADAIARPVYRAEAKEIERIRKGVLEISAREEPYDVFICYKETDEDGNRTVDSLIAQDVYTALTEKGYRVFFSRISLEDKLGQEYEPYIFAALHSARVMLAFGTSYENYNAVWVKNEWSRYLALIAKGEKKTLIPCYKDLDAYDMPKEFQRFQAQDMGKVGAMQDLLRGVEKIIGKKAEPTKPAQQIVQQIVQGGGPNVAALLERGNMALEDQEWEKAKDYFDQVLSMDAKCGEAYLGLAMAEAKSSDRNKYATAYISANSPLRSSKNVARAKTFSLTIKTWFSEIDAEAQLADEKERAAEEKKAEKERLAREKEAEKERLARERDKERISPVRLSISAASGMISAYANQTIGIKVDGTVLSTGVGADYSSRYDIDDWRNIVAVSEGWQHIVGLKSNGTVLATMCKDDEKDNYGQCDVGDWHDIVAIAAGGEHTVGLRKDGSVLSTGNDYNGQCEVSDWHDVIAISAGWSHTIGLKSNGTVLATRDIDGCSGQCDVSSWRDIVAISAGNYSTVALKADGTVLAVGENDYGQCEVGEWRGIVAITAGESHTVGLKADGTVIAVGNNRWNQCQVNDWCDIVAIAAGGNHTVGLKADGTVLAVGYNEFGQCEVDGWKLFNSVGTIEEERKVAAKQAKAATERAKAAAERAEAERQARIANLNQEKTDLQAELSNLRGLFTGKRRREIEARLAEIEGELKKLG